MYTDHVITADEHDRWLAGALGDAGRTYWIIEAEGAPAGLANLYDIDPDNRRAAWAYYLAAPAARGHGVGAFVEFLVLEHVFVERAFN
jgi:RimJ/RimL family protein N-acetyltransferase